MYNSNIKFRRSYYQESQQIGLCCIDDICVEYPPNEGVCEENVSCDFMVPSYDLDKSIDGD